MPRSLLIKRLQVKGFARVECSLQDSAARVPVENRFCYFWEPRIMTDETRTAGVSRRTVVKGIAWATPVVAVTTAIPAYAASPGCLVSVTGRFVRWGSSHGVVRRWLTLEFDFEVRSNCTVQLDAVQLGDLKITRGNENYVPDAVGGDLIGPARTLSPGVTTLRFEGDMWWQFTEGTWRWPNQAVFTFRSDSNNGSTTVTIPSP